MAERLLIADTSALLDRPHLQEWKLDEGPRTLPWLRADVPDDALIAAVLELVWQDLTSRAAITASDRHLGNKGPGSRGSEASIPGS